jgi:hypothetical protein
MVLEPKHQNFKYQAPYVQYFGTGSALNLLPNADLVSDQKPKITVIGKDFI